MKEGEGKEWEAVFAKLAELNVETIMLSGGDPLQRDDLFELIRGIRGYGMKVYLAVTGVGVSEERCSRLCEAEPDMIFLGLDPFSGGDKDAAATENSRAVVKRLIESGHKITGNLIVTHRNIGELEKIAGEFKRLGIMHLNLLRPKPDRNGMWFSESRLTAEDLLRLQILRLRIARKESMRLSLDCAFGCLVHGLLPQKFLLQRFLYACNAGMTYFHINADGEIFPCPYLTERQFSCGNAFTDNIRDIWRDAPVFMKLRNHDNLKGNCSDCPIRLTCRGCRAIARYDSDDLFGEDEDCPFNGDSYLSCFKQALSARWEMLLFALKNMYRKRESRKLQKKHHIASKGKK